MIPAIHGRTSTEQSDADAKSVTMQAGAPHLANFPLLSLALLLLSIGCGSGVSKERGTEEVAAFFANTAKVGSSPDAGLFKYNVVGEWEHVATVHGMSDDIDFCDDIANGLKQKYPDQRYSCRLLNK